MKGHGSRAGRLRLGPAMGIAGIVACSAPTFGCATTMVGDPGTMPASMELSSDDAESDRIVELETRIAELERDLRRVTPQATTSVRLAPTDVDAEDSLLASAESFRPAESVDVASEPSAGPRTVLRLHESRPVAPAFPISSVTERLPIVEMPAAPPATTGVPTRAQPSASPLVQGPAASPELPPTVDSVPVAAVAPSPRPAPTEDLREYRLGLGHLTARRYEAAVASLSAFLRDHPGSAQADDALYWRGTSHYALRRYREALVDYERVVRLSPRGERAADSLYHSGLCYRRLGDDSRARGVFTRLQSEYPNSVAARLALREDTT